MTSTTSTTSTTCTTCGRPADDGYVNEAAGERCVDAVHGAPDARSNVWDAGATGATHAHGPIGAALGSFVGFADGATIAGMYSALLDSASQEFTWLTEGESPKERAYHRARWLEQLDAADYLEPMVNRMMLQDGAAA